MISLGLKSKGTEDARTCFHGKGYRDCNKDIHIVYQVGFNRIRFFKGFHPNPKGQTWVFWSGSGLQRKTTWLRTRPNNIH